MNAPRAIKSKKEIVLSLRAGMFRREKSLSIHCDTVAAIAFREILELYLYLSRVRQWEWVDLRGRVIVQQSFPRVVASLLCDFLCWLPLYLRILNVVRRLTKDVGRRGKIGRGSSLLFLRTDHWFNIQSGGSVGHLRGVISGLRALGYRTQVVSTDYLAGVDRENNFYLCEPAYGRGRNVPSLPELLYNDQMVQFIRPLWGKLAPAFVYQRYSLGNYSGVTLKQAYGVPYVCEYNGSFPWMARHWGGRRLFHEGLVSCIELLNLYVADLVVVVSQPMKSELVERGVEPAKILVNPNGVDSEQYAPDVDGSEIRRKYGLQDKMVVGFIGTFGPWHGAEMLAEAFGRLLTEFPGYREQVRLLMIGDGPRMQQVREVLEGLRVENAAVLTSLVPQEQGPMYLAACDILVSPHVPNPDGTPFFGSPTKLFEYMAMGKGIVASDLDQIGEVLEDGETAVLVEPGNVEELVQGIVFLVENPDEAERMGRNARRVVCERHTWYQNARRVVEALQ